MKYAVICLLILLAARTAEGHKLSTSHLTLAVHGDTVDGRLEIAIRDLDTALVLDTNGDGDITWAEVMAARPRISDYVADRLGLTTSAGPCSLQQGEIGLVDLSDGPYWTVQVHGRCAAAIDALTIKIGLLFDVDAQHRALVHITGGPGQTLVIRDATPVRAALAARTTLRDFVQLGIWHIWHGLDHLLFLTCLILPAVYVSKRSGRRARTLRSAAVEVLEIVTAFTLAHSITLVLSASGLVRLPSHVVETAIALSVAAAGLNNLVRLVDARWLVAFSLGLLHGFGFSNVLIDLGLPSRELIVGLLGFNIGVELGQAAFVVLLLPVLFAIRRTRIYQLALWGGSAAIAMLALVWSYERWFS